MAKRSISREELVLLKKQYEELKDNNDELIRLTESLQEEIKSREVENALSTAQFQRDIESLTLNRIVKLENELTHYRTGCAHNKDLSDFCKLNEKVKLLEQKNSIYEKTYSSLLQDYLTLRKVAKQNGLPIAPRSGPPHPLHPERSLSSLSTEQTPNNNSPN